MEVKKILFNDLFERINMSRDKEVVTIGGKTYVITERLPAKCHKASRPSQIKGLAFDVVKIASITSVNYCYVSWTIEI